MGAEGDAFDRRAQALAAAFERACHRAAGAEDMEGVYVSPLWETYTSSGPGRSRAWKISVLRRVPGAGAEPWGHVYLVVTSHGRPDMALDSTETGIPSGGEGDLPVAVPPPERLDEGPPSVWVLLRPRSLRTQEPLIGFVARVRRGWTAPPGT
jgi:hypothetical protein